MKRILLLIAAAVLLVPCAAQNKALEKALGDKFAFAGLETAKLVPAFATEISDLKTDPRSESKPMKDEAFFYSGSDITKIPAAKVQAYLQNVYAAVKKAADGGVVYKAKGYAGDQRGDFFRNVFPDRDIIQEKQRLRAAANDVVDAHRDAVDADGIVLTHQEGDL